MGGEEVLMIITNAFFFIPSVKAATLHRWTRAALYFFMIFASSFYHACNSFMDQCVLPADVGRKTDFFFAQLLIPVTALYIVKFPLRFAFIERWLILGFAVALYLVEIYFNEPLWMQIVVVGISVLVIAIYWISYAVAKYNEYVKYAIAPANYRISRDVVVSPNPWDIKPKQEVFFRCEKRKECHLPKYDWDAFAMGIGLTSLACVLFVTQGEWHLGRPYVHSVWHTAAAFGQYFILCIRDAAPRNAALDARLVASKRR